MRLTPIPKTKEPPMAPASIKYAEQGLLQISILSAVFFTSGILLTGYKLGDNHTLKRFRKEDVLNLITINGVMITLLFVTCIAFFRMHMLRISVLEARRIQELKRSEETVYLDKSS